ncbi:MAG: hypothetical protein ACE5OZ_23010 [Candidatus Heimdallarchaeota archaeon]
MHHSKGNKEKEHHLTATTNILKGNDSDYLLLCANCHVLANIDDGTWSPWIKHLTEKDFSDILQGKAIARKYVRSDNK